MDALQLARDSLLIRVGMQYLVLELQMLERSSLTSTLRPSLPLPKLTYFGSNKLHSCHEQFIVSVGGIFSICTSKVWIGSPPNVNVTQKTIWYRSQHLQSS